MWRSCALAPRRCAARTSRAPCPGTQGSMCGYPSTVQKLDQMVSAAARWCSGETGSLQPDFSKHRHTGMGISGGLTLVGCLRPSCRSGCTLCPAAAVHLCACGRGNEGKQPARHHTNSLQPESACKQPRMQDAALQSWTCGALPSSRCSGRLQQHTRPAGLAHTHSSVLCRRGPRGRLRRRPAYPHPCR